MHDGTVKRTREGGCCAPPSLREGEDTTKEEVVVGAIHDSCLGRGLGYAILVPHQLQAADPHGDGGGGGGDP